MDDLSNATMAAAGLREGSSWALRIPALLAVVAVVSLFAIDRSGASPSAVYGGAAVGHKAPASELFLLIFAILGGSALLTGLLGRVRVHTLLWFNVASAGLASLGLAIVFVSIESSEHGFGMWTLVGIIGLAFNWIMSFAVLQMGAALIGRGLRTVVVQMLSS